MNVRRPTEADFSAVLTLLRAADEVVLAETDWTAETLREHSDDLDLDRDAWIVELDRRLAGYVDADSTTGATRLYERVGMRAFSRTVVYEKELRAA